MHDQKLNIHQRLLAIMAELDYIQKGESRVNNQYRFVSHDQVSAKLHPYLVKHGVLAIPTTEDITQEGNRTTIKLLVTFFNVDKPEDCIQVKFPGYGVDPSDKGPGKAVSYAFKLACLKTLCLETGEDPDQDQNTRYEPVKCQEFDSLLPEMSSKETQRLEKFLKHSAEVMNKHVEDVKREALNRMPEFLKALKNWDQKKKEE